MKINVVHSPIEIPNSNSLFSLQSGKYVHQHEQYLHYSKESKRNSSVEGDKIPINNIIHVGAVYVARNGQVRFVTLSIFIDSRYAFSLYDLNVCVLIMKLIYQLIFLIISSG